MRAAWLVLLVFGSACQRGEPGAPVVLDTGATVDTLGSEVAPSIDGLEEMLEPVRSANGLPALAGAVFSSDALLAIGAVGVRKHGDPTPVTRDDVFHLGSDTKAMTATLLALHVAETRISWSTRLSSAFPEAMDAAYRDVSIEQLLQHRGGAPANVPADLWTEMWKVGDPRTQRRAAVIGMLQRPPETPPGTAFVYANAGYMMAGAALEDAVGESWESLMKKRLFSPLGMKSCDFGAPATAGLVDQPWGHVLKSGTPSPIAPGPGADNPPSLGPAGTVKCGLVDWGKFLQLHLRGARGEATTLLDPASFARMQTPPSGGDYAFGWGVTTRSWASGAVLTHSGSNTMFFVTVWIAPKKNRIFVAATNLGGDGAAKGVDAAFGPMIEKYAK